MSSKPVNILYVFTHLNKGGAQIQYLNFIKNLPDNVKSYISTIKNEGPLATEYRKAGIPVYSLNYKTRISVRGFISLLKIIKKYSIDVVITVGYGDSLFWGRLAAIIMRIKLIYSSLHTFPEIGGSFDFFNKLLNVYNTRFLPCTNKLKEVILNDNSMPKNRVSTFYNGIILTDFKNLQNHRDSDYVIDLINRIKDYKTIVQVGKLIHYKNQILTLKVFEKLVKNDRLNNLRLLLIGDGPDKIQIEDFIKKNDLQEYVLLASYLLHKDCIYIMSKSHIVVSSSTSEAFPNNLIEAAMLKKPIIASNVGGVCEIVIHDKSGYIFENGDEETYYLYLKKLIQNPSLFKKFGENGHNHVIDNYSMDMKIKRFLEFLDEDLKE